MDKATRNQYKMKFQTLRKTIQRREERIVRTQRTLAEAKDEWAALLVELGNMEKEDRLEIMSAVTGAKS